MCGGATGPLTRAKKSLACWLTVKDPAPWSKVSELRVRAPRLWVLLICAVPVMTMAVVLLDTGPIPPCQFAPVLQRLFGPSPDQRTTSAATGAAAAARRTVAIEALRM